jgi:hypothetical protein
MSKAKGWSGAGTRGQRVVVRDQRAVRTDTPAGREPPTIVFDDSPALHPRRAWRLSVAALLAVLVAALLAVLVVGAGRWLTSGDDQVAVRPAAAAVAPAPVHAPAGLAVTVAAPTTVVAGHAARFVVSYTDGEGIFSGSVEDWGETGVGSMKQRACAASAPAGGPVKGSYVATHKWRKAGSYPVSFSVTTYTCSSGRATEETQNAALTVVAAAR